jgi:hypothetical protein
MEFTRRAVLKVTSLAGTALLLPLDVLDAATQEPAALGADNRPMGTSPLHMTRSLLRGHVGSDFLARTPAGNRVRLRLTEVEDIPNAEAAHLEGSEESFAARFQDSSGHLLSQGTYRLDHDTLGRLWFFLVPVGQPAAEAQTYEAIFNNAPVPASGKPRRRAAR